MNKIWQAALMGLVVGGAMAAGEILAALIHERTAPKSTARPMPPAMQLVEDEEPAGA